MQIAINDQDVDEFMGIINRIAQEHPILVDKYLMGKEIEVDAVCDGEEILIPGIMEHIERAGNSFRGQHFRIPGPEPDRKNQKSHRGIYKKAGPRAPRDRPD